MAAGDVHRRADGTIGINGAGEVLLQDGSDDCPECCDECTASASICSNCSAGVTPVSYNVTFSNVSLCDVCHYNSALVACVKIDWATTDVLNTAHTLTQVGGGGANNCIWTKTISNAVDIDEGNYTGAACTCTDYSSTNVDIGITLSKFSATEYMLYVYAQSSLTGFNQFYTIFYKEITVAAGDCELNNEVFNNGNNATDGTDCGNRSADGVDPTGGENGTGTVSCN